RRAFFMRPASRKFTKFMALRARTRGPCSTVPRTVCAPSSPLVIADGLAAAGLAQSFVEIVDTLGRALLFRHILERLGQRGKLPACLVARIAGRGSERLRSR